MSELERKIPYAKVLDLTQQIVRLLRRHWPAQGQRRFDEPITFDGPIYAAWPSAPIAILLPVHLVPDVERIMLASAEFAELGIAVQELDRLLRPGYAECVWRDGLLLNVAVPVRGRDLLAVQHFVLLFNRLLETPLYDVSIARVVPYPANLPPRYRFDEAGEAVRCGPRLRATLDIEAAVMVERRMRIIEVPDPDGDQVHAWWTFGDDPKPAKPATERPIPPVLNATDQNAAAYIREHPGCTGQEVADAIHRTFEHFRSKIVPKLKAHGYTNPRNGDGYFPPSM